MEIQTLMDAPMENAYHELVRDMFVFSVFTGLAYSDVKNLTTDKLQTFFDGNLWIITRRKKTNAESNIRLLDVPRKIIEKYKGITRDSHVFPMTSTTCNKILKDIGRQFGFKTRLTYHVARHTNSTTVLLSNDVPIETVSRLLGHTRPRRYTPKSPIRRLVWTWKPCRTSWRIWRKTFTMPFNNLKTEYQ